MSRNSRSVHANNKPATHHNRPEDETPRAASGNGDDRPNTTKSDRHKPNWVEKGTLAVLLLTFFAACYAGYEANRLAGLTQTLASDAVSASAAQLRAYVGIENIELITDAPVQNGTLVEGQAGYVYPDYLEITLKNFGATTAFYVSDYLNYASGPFATDLPSNFAFPDAPNAFPADLPHPGRESATLDSGQTYLARHVLPKKAVQKFKTAQAEHAIMYIYGHINMCDIYNRKWVRDWAFMYTPWVSAARKFESIDRHQGDHQDGNC